MASHWVPGSQALTPSLLDRLVDEAPDGAAPVVLEWDWSRHISSLLADVQALFNSRQHFKDEELAEAPRARDSLLTYGLPEFDVALKQGQDAQRMLQAALKEALRRFEPRLTNVQITSLGDLDETRIARFRLEGDVLARPAPRRISFDTQLDLERAEVKVQGEP